MSRRAWIWVGSGLLLALAGIVVAVLAFSGGDPESAATSTGGEATTTTAATTPTATTPPPRPLQPLEREPPAMLVVNGEPTLRLWLALTPEQRSEGVKGRPILPGEALGFGWQEPTEDGFWMGGVNYEIVLVWVGLDRRVIGLEKMTPCPAADDTCKVYEAPGPFRWAVEILPEDLERSGLRVGAGVEFERIDGGAENASGPS